jgi:hypothetical protein
MQACAADTRTSFSAVATPHWSLARNRATAKEPIAADELLQARVGIAFGSGLKSSVHRG